MTKISDHPGSFPSIGIGRLLARSFDAKFSLDSEARRRVYSGGTLFVGSDYSGQHKKSDIHVYSVGMYDLENCQEWEVGRQQIRKEFGLSNRRMSFKNLNDKRRRNALIPFLRNTFAAPSIFATFAIDKRIGSLFETSNDENPDAAKLLRAWRPKIRERLLTALHIASFLVAGFSRSGQDVLWFTDEDEIASNDLQITNLTELFAIVSSHYLRHDLRHFRCGSTRSDSGTRDLEDLIAVPDLLAGAFSEMVNNLSKSDSLPIGKVVVPVTSGTSWKSRLVLSWTCSQMMSEACVFCLIDESDATRNLRCRFIQLENISV